MGALGQFIDEQKKENTNLKLEVGELKMRIADLETELSDIKGRYDSLCSKIKKDANDKRNIDNGDDFLRNYAKNWK